MADDTWTCDFCSKDIPQEQFEQGLAVILLSRRYCPDCAAEAIRKSKSESFVPMWRTPRPSEVKQLSKKSLPAEAGEPSQ